MDFSNNYLKFIFTGLVLIIISVGLFVLLRLTQNKQVVKTKASGSAINININSPRQDSKILGTTQLRATVDTAIQAQNLTSVMQIDGKESQVLTVEQLDSGRIAISGKWDSSKVTVGSHTLEFFLYDHSSSTTSSLGSSRVSVTVVPP